MTALATVSGQVYFDVDGDGVFNLANGDTPLPNVSVVITDLNGNPQTVETDENGLYQAIVQAGSTTVDIDTSDPDIPAGGVLNEGAGSDPITVNTVSGQDTVATNYGFEVVDSDGDGVPDNEDICPDFSDNEDNDGDLIPDGCDDDDDNDGILDLSLIHISEPTRPY